MRFATLRYLEGVTVIKTNLKVELLAYTPDADKLCATAAKTCYSPNPILAGYSSMKDETADRMINQVSASGHTSTLEHASFTFAIEGVSRSLLAQITRHRVASFSVQSQRYVSMDDFEYIVPDAIAQDMNVMRLFEDEMAHDAEQYKKISRMLLNTYMAERYCDIFPLDRNDSFYALRLATFARGAEFPVHRLEQYKKDVAAGEKYAIENARAVLPNACATRIVMTMNARELLHFFSLRCCNRAQDEIRALADEMLKQCRSVAPSLFANAGPGCVRDACPEGKMSCHSPRKDLKV